MPAVKDPFTLSTLSQIQHMPNEILMHILTLCCYHMTDENDWPKAFPGIEITLSHVCHLWRQITLKALPEIWSLISIAQPIRGHYIHLVEIYLQRSVNHPLRFSIVEFAFDQQMGMINDIFGLIIQHYNRWQVIRYVSRYRAGRSLPLLDIPSGGSPMLETVILEARSLVQTEVDTFFGRLQCSPRFRQLSLHGCGIPNIFLPQLTHVVLQSVSLADVLRFLPHLHGIIHFDVFFTCGAPFTYASQSIRPRQLAMVLAHLRSLRVTSISSAIEHFFDSITAPQLEELSLDIDSLNYFGASWTALSSLLSRSLCSVRAYSLRAHDQFDDSHLQHLKWPALGSIQEIHISHDELPPSALNGLFLSRKKTPFLPELKRITVDCPGLANGTFSRIVASRLPPHIQERLQLGRGSLDAAKKNTLDACQRAHLRDIDAATKLATEDITLNIGRHPTRRSLVRYTCDGLPIASS